MIVLEE